MRVLIVDDNAEFAAMLQSALATSGYDVQVALNGPQALADQYRFKAQAVILDLFMPEMDGFETLITIRKEFPGTRVIVASGSAKLDASHYLKAAELMGVDLTLRKPFEMTALLEKLDAIRASLDRPSGE
jgi:DNA-binding response OmpR family regulator